MFELMIITVSVFYIFLQSLCCVDKKGILSYPNPSPEKVFFLQKPPEEENTTELNDSDSPTENKDPNHHHHHHRPRYEKKRKKTDPGTEEEIRCVFDDN